MNQRLSRRFIFLFFAGLTSGFVIGQHAVAGAVIDSFRRLNSYWRTGAEISVCEASVAFGGRSQTSSFRGASSAVDAAGGYFHTLSLKAKDRWLVAMGDAEFELAQFTLRFDSGFRAVHPAEVIKIISDAAAKPLDLLLVSVDEFRPGPEGLEAFSKPIKIVPSLRHPGSVALEVPVIQFFDGGKIAARMLRLSGYMKLGATDLMDIQSPVERHWYRELPETARNRVDLDLEKIQVTYFDNEIQGLEMEMYRLLGTSDFSNHREADAIRRVLPGRHFLARLEFPSLEIAQQMLKAMAEEGDLLTVRN